MRHREKIVPGNLVITKATGYKSTGSCSEPFGWQLWPAYDKNGSYIDCSSTEKYDDVVVEHFEKRRDHGEIFMNPMYKTVTQTVNTAIDWHSLIAWWGYTYCPQQTVIHTTLGSKQHGTVSPSELVGTYPTTPSVDEETVKAVATTAAWANVSTADINAYATLAESGETVQSFLQITGRIIRIANQLRRGNLAAVWKQFTPKQLADRWMEGRYAVRPLVYDICAVRAALQPLCRPERQTYRGSHSATARNVEIKSSIFASTWYRVWGRFTTERTITARAGVLAAIEEISTISRWGLDQPLEAIWELIPFSFVCDWFLNVGQVLASWTPQLGIRALASWVTVSNTVVKSKVIDHTDDLYVWVPTTYNRELSITGGACSTTTSIIYRQPHPGRPVVPHLKVRLDAAKLLDLVIMAKKILA